MPTLWLSELSLLDARLDSLVELGIKSGRRRDGDVVVCQNILLDGLAAVRDTTSASGWTGRGIKQRAPEPRHRQLVGASTERVTYLLPLRSFNWKGKSVTSSSDRMEYRAR